MNHRTLGHERLLPFIVTTITWVGLVWGGAQWKVVWSGAGIQIVGEGVGTTSITRSQPHSARFHAVMHSPSGFITIFDNSGRSQALSHEPQASSLKPL